MAKLQSYSITFNTSQSDADAAMYVVGSNVNSSIRNHTQSEMLLGNVTDDTIALSDDGLVLTVSRTWTDSAYDALVQIASESEIQTMINNLTTVSSATYGFSDT